MAQLRLSPELARAWIKDKDTIPPEWKEVITKKKWPIIKSVAFGFGISDEDGDRCATDMTPKEFKRWAKRQGKCRVYVKNKRYDDLISMISYLENKRKIAFSGGDIYHINTAVDSLRYLAKNESEYDFYFMPLNEYEDFYKKNISHKVDFVDASFFDIFAKARRA